MCDDVFCDNNFNPQLHSLKQNLYCEGFGLKVNELFVYCSTAMSYTYYTTPFYVTVRYSCLSNKRVGLDIWVGWKIHPTRSTGG